MAEVINVSVHILETGARLWRPGLVALGAALLSVACSQPQAASTDQARVATYWKQLTEVMKPVDLKSMTDHRAYMLANGHIIALHFDSMDLSKAQNLNWMALGVPGTFTRADQERVEREFGKGFTHFHDLENDVHGGQPGAEGAWFVHVAVRDFESPMSGGQVKAGVDTKFMPTPPPQ